MLLFDSGLDSVLFVYNCSTITHFTMTFSTMTICVIVIGKPLFLYWLATFFSLFTIAHIKIMVKIMI